MFQGMRHLVTDKLNEIFLYLFQVEETNLCKAPREVNVTDWSNIPFSILIFAHIHL